jgi:hypothetical protein
LQAALDLQVSVTVLADFLSYRQRPGISVAFPLALSATALFTNPVRAHHDRGAQEASAPHIWASSQVAT